MILHIVYTSKYSHSSKFMKIMKILQNDENLQFRRSGRHLGMAIDQNIRNSLTLNKID